MMIVHVSPPQLSYNSTKQNMRKQYKQMHSVFFFSFLLYDSALFVLFVQCSGGWTIRVGLRQFVLVGFGFLIGLYVSC